MPTYDYECLSCGHTFEKFQSMTARPGATCPRCRKRKVKRRIGAGAGIIFKGSGFYQTDYRSESYRKQAEKDKPKSDTDKKSTDKSPPKGSSESGETSETSGPDK